MTALIPRGIRVRTRTGCAALFGILRELLRHTECGVRAGRCGRRACRMQGRAAAGGVLGVAAGRSERWRARRDPPGRRIA